MILQIFPVLRLSRAGLPFMQVWWLNIGLSKWRVSLLKWTLRQSFDIAKLRCRKAVWQFSFLSRAKPLTR